MMEGIIIKEIVFTDTGDSMLPEHQNDSQISKLAFEILGPDIMILSERIIYQPSKGNGSYFIIKDRHNVEGWINLK